MLLSWVEKRKKAAKWDIPTKNIFLICPPSTPTNYYSNPLVSAAI
jgi:hypothetical protein